MGCLIECTIAYSELGSALAEPYVTHEDVEDGDCNIEVITLHSKIGFQAYPNVALAPEIKVNIAVRTCNTAVSCMIEARVELATSQ